MSEERLRRFFVHEGDHYRVRQEVRDIVLFAIHDLLKDPPFYSDTANEELRASNGCEPYPVVLTESGATGLLF